MASESQRPEWCLCGDHVSDPHTHNPGEDGWCVDCACEGPPPQRPEPPDEVWAGRASTGKWCPQLREIDSSDIRYVPAARLESLLQELDDTEAGFHAEVEELQFKLEAAEAEVERLKWDIVGNHAQRSIDKAGIERLQKAVMALLVVMDNGSKPEKLDAALTWRANDEKAERMARSALAATEPADG